MIRLQSLISAIERFGLITALKDGGASKRCLGILFGGIVQAKNSDGINKEKLKEKNNVVFKDMRQDFINTTNLRNDIEVLLLVMKVSILGRKV